MDIYTLADHWGRKLKLALLYAWRIVGAPNHFHCSTFVRLKANLLGGFTGDQWMLYSLDAKKRREFLSEFDMYRSRYINEPFNFMLNNKVVADEVLEKYIRVPEMYAVRTRGKMRDRSGRPLDSAGVLALVREKGQAIIKPYDRGKGLGVHRFGYRDGRYYMDAKEVDEATAARAMDTKQNWYMSEVIEQHAYSDGLYDKTVNTIRMITFRDPKTQQFKLFYAVHRIGISKTIPVDNASQGSIVCKIDLDTGRLSYGRTLHDLTVYETHPDSGTRFEDVTIPDWQALKEEIVALSERFPYLNFIAWDVVKLRDGTNCVIEANTSSGVNIVQLWGGQRHGELGDFYRYHGIIKD